MVKKKGGKKGERPARAVKKSPVIDLTDEEHWNPGLSVFKIEYCTNCFVFRKKADEFLALCSERFLDNQFMTIFNNWGVEKPRPGAFEIELAKNAKCPFELLWSGLEKGPPRKEKFPSDWEPILCAVQLQLKQMCQWEIEEAKRLEEEDEEDD